MSETIRTRAEIPAKYKWNAASVFASDEAWDAGADSLLRRLNEVKEMAGSVGKNAKTLANALATNNELQGRLGRIDSHKVVRLIYW